VTWSHVAGLPAWARSTPTVATACGADHNADGFEAALQTLSPYDRVRFATHEVTRRRNAASIAKRTARRPSHAKINDLKGGR